MVTDNYLLIIRKVSLLTPWSILVLVKVSLFGQRGDVPVQVREYIWRSSECYSLISGCQFCLKWGVSKPSEGQRHVHAPHLLSVTQHLVLRSWCASSLCFLKLSCLKKIKQIDICRGCFQSCRKKETNSQGEEISQQCSVCFYKVNAQSQRERSQASVTKLCLLPC